MHLSGEVRESVSLDEDEISDIDDEVFVRDGKRGYKFEDVSVKKPLMAPRRKLTKSKNISTLIRKKQSCKALCRPFCYAVLALGTLLGLIALVIVLVSLFPLPLDKFRDWIALKASVLKSQKKIVQCSDIDVYEIWKIDFPKLTSETAVNVLDVNHDGVEDVIFGFSTGNDESIPSETFCLLFMNTSEPCGGGVMALNGTNGNLLWKHWSPGPVFDLICDTDYNGDNISDCLVAGKSGLLRTINSKNGKLIWDFLGDESVPSSKINVYQPSIIVDVDDDNVSDIVATHSIESDVVVGHLVIISGKNGTLLQKVSTPNGGVASYCKPQLLKIGANYSVLFGTGSLTTGGALYLIGLRDLLRGNISASQILYKDQHKGVLSPSVLVDITGDGTVDIVSSIFNSTVIAIDGITLELIWNYTIPNSETLSVPIPGYFNNDNVTDFMVKYQTGLGFPVYYYSQTYILDGKTGRPIIYLEPFVDTLGAQMGGLTIETEKFGYDWFLYWTGDCKGHEGSQDIFQFVNGPDDEPTEVKIRKQTQSDLCLLRYNSSTVANIYALSQFDQPPGFKIYNSEYESFNKDILPNPVKEAREFFKAKAPDEKVVEKSDQDSSSFRHKNNKAEGSKTENNNKSSRILNKQEQIPKKHQHQSSEVQPEFGTDYDRSSDDWFSYPQSVLGEDIDSDYDSPYMRDPEDQNVLNSNMKLLNSKHNMNNRDPRSKTNSAKTDEERKPEKKVHGKKGRHGKALKKNLAEKKYGIYDYQNIQNSQKRLLSDLNTLPSQILRETYFKEQERKLKKSKFEVRDLNPQEKSNRKNSADIDFKNITNSNNASYTLWDLESENEMHEKKGGGYWRGKRENDETFRRVPRTTTIGSLVKPLNKNSTGLDFILVTYWVPSVTETEVLLEDDIKCIDRHLKETMNSKDKPPLFTPSAIEDAVIDECLKRRGVFKNKKVEINNSTSQFPYFKEIMKLKFGILSVHRLSIQCKCAKLREEEQCSKFLDAKDQHWSSYLGNFGNGLFHSRN